jgi:SSS family transporter
MTKAFYFGLLFLPGMIWAEPLAVAKDEYFRVSEIVDRSESEVPTVAWRDHGGLNLQVDGVFLRQANGGRQFTEIPGGAPAIAPSAVTTSANGKLYVIDGAEVFTLQVTGGRVSRSKLGELPMPVQNGSAVISREKLYVAGQDNAGRNAFLRAEKVLLAESQGVVYLFADEDGSGRLHVYAYNPNLRLWSTVGVSEHPVRAETAFSCGNAHILFLGKEMEHLTGYYITQKKWVAFPLPLLPSGPFVVAAEHSFFSLITDRGASKIEAILPGTKYGLFDHLIVASFFVLMLWIGKHFSKRERSEDDFFRGGQRLPWWAVGLSLFATGASAISLMAMPAKAYTENWIYFTGGLFQLLFLPVTFLYIMPIARRLRFGSAFQYLEARFSPSVRMLGSLIYVALQIFGRMATIMLLPALALTTICGIPMEISIVLMGVITTIYCTMGGFEAVVWTDAIQAVVMLLAMILCAGWILFSLNLPASDAWQLVAAEDKLRLADFGWDVTQPIIYILFVNGLLTVFGQLGDQNFIQRVQATRSERETKLAIFAQLGVAIPLNACLFALGTLLFLYYNGNPSAISPAMKADSIFPLFAAQALPTGLAGLVVAALMAATMSTLSSALNSVSNICVEDYVRRIRSNLSDRGAYLWGKGLTLFFGVFGTGLALVLARTNLVSILDMIILIAGILFSPMTGVFMLGILTRRTTSSGAWAGMVAGIGGAYYCNTAFVLSPFFFSAISISLCMITGYVFSLLLPSDRRDLAGLTIYSLPKNIEET